VKQAIEQVDAAAIEDEIGDLLFASVNIARFMKVNPEMALMGATDKFISRFAMVEKQVLEQGKCMEDLTLAELDVIWNQVKKQK